MCALSFYDDCRCSPSLTTLPMESELTSSIWTGSLERPEVPPPHPPQTSLRPSKETHSLLCEDSILSTENSSVPKRKKIISTQTWACIRRPIHSNEKKDIFEKDSYYNITRTTTYFYMKCSQKNLHSEYHNVCEYI